MGKQLVLVIGTSSYYVVDSCGDINYAWLTFNDSISFLMYFIIIIIITNVYLLIPFSCCLYFYEHQCILHSFIYSFHPSFIVASLMARPFFCIMESLFH